MNIESSAQGGIAVVKISGRMREDAPLLEQACSKQLEDGLRKIVVDVADLEYVSSLGLRSFVAVAKACQKTGAVVAISGMKGMVKEIFEIAHLSSLFPTFKSTDEALAGL